MIDRDDDPYDYLFEHASDVERMLTAEVELDAYVTWSERMRARLSHPVLLGLVAVVAIASAVINLNLSHREESASEPATPRSRVAAAPSPVGAASSPLVFGSDEAEFAELTELRRLLDSTVKDESWRRDVHSRVDHWPLDELVWARESHGHLTKTLLKAIWASSYVERLDFVRSVADAPRFQGTREARLAGQILTDLEAVSGAGAAVPATRTRD